MLIFVLSVHSTTDDKLCIKLLCRAVTMGGTFTFTVTFVSHGAPADFHHVALVHSLLWFGLCRATLDKGICYINECEY